MDGSLELYLWKYGLLDWAQLCQSEQSAHFIQQMMEGVKDIVSSMESSSEAHPKTSALALAWVISLNASIRLLKIPSYRFIAKFILPTIDQGKCGRAEGKCYFS